MAGTSNAPGTRLKCTYERIDTSAQGLTEGDLGAEDYVNDNSDGDDAARDLFTFSNQQENISSPGCATISW